MTAHATLEGWVSQAFRSSPGGYNPGGGHTGRDKALDVGTKLYARRAGVVLWAGPLRGGWADNPWLLVPDWAGNVMVIDYGPFISIYAHIGAWHVRTGDRVREGQHVCDSGNSGSATSGPHLHEEALPDGWDVMNGVYGRVDPALYDDTITVQGAVTAPDEDHTETLKEEQIMGKIVLATNGKDPDVWWCEAGRRHIVGDWRQVEVMKDLCLRGVLDIFHGGPEYRLQDMVQTVWYLDALGKVDE